MSTEQAAFGTLKKEIARLKEDAGRLEEQNKQLEKQIQQLKNQGAQAQAQVIAEKLLSEKRIEMGLVIMAHTVPGLEGHDALRGLVDSFRMKEKMSVVFLSDQQGNCVVYCDADAQEMGIHANVLLDLAKKELGGSGGGKADRAQGRLQDPNKLTGLRDWLLVHLREKAKKS